MTVVLAVMTSVYVAFRDINVQSLMARTAAGILSDKLHTKVRIKTLYVTMPPSIHIEEAQMNDLYDIPMFNIGSFDLKFGFANLNKGIKIKSIEFENVLGNVVKYESDDLLNVMAVFQPFSGNEAKESNGDFNLEFTVDRLSIKNGRVVYWNQHDDYPERLTMDYSHIDISGINAEIEDFTYLNDTIRANIKKLSGKDRCGLTLESFSANAMVCHTRVDAMNLLLKTQSSSLDVDYSMVFNDGLNSFDEYVDSVKMIGNLRPSTVVISDLRYFSWLLDKMPDTLVTFGRFEGTVNDFTYTDFTINFKDDTKIAGTLAAKGLPEMDDPYFNFKIKELTSSYKDLAQVALPISSGKIPLTESMASIGKISVLGYFAGYPDDYAFDLSVQSGIGSVNVYSDFKGRNDLEHSSYSTNLSINNLNLTDVLEMDEPFEMDLDLSIKGEGATEETTYLDFQSNVKHLNFNGNRFRDINIKGNFEDMTLALKTSISHPYLYFSLDGQVDFNNEKPCYDIKAMIQDADLYNLHLVDSDTILISTNIDAQICATSIDDITGKLSLKNSSYFDNHNYYKMENFDAVVADGLHSSKNIDIDCDFFDLNFNGIFDIPTLPNALKNYVMNYTDVPIWDDKKHFDAKEQDFHIELAVKDTKTLTKLFIPELNISKGTIFSASFTSKQNYLNTYFESSEIEYNDVSFRNIEMSNGTSRDRGLFNLSLKDIIVLDTTQGDPTSIGIDNITVGASLFTDSICMRVRWEDAEPTSRDVGDVNTSLVTLNDKDLRIYLTASDLLIDDTVWNVNNNCYFDFIGDRILINNFNIYSTRQSINIEGAVPFENADTLNINFENYDFSNFDLITKELGFDLDGYLNGNCHLSGLNDHFAFLADLKIDDFALNGQQFEETSIRSVWNNPDTSIIVKAEIKNSFLLDGKIYSERENNLDFDLSLNGMELSVISPFTKSILSRIKGNLTGDLKINGSFDKPDVFGKVTLADAGMKIDFLNTYYTMNHTFNIKKDKIEIQDLIITDTLDNKAKVNGEITHNYFNDFKLNIKMDVDNFLGLDMLADSDNGFYGSAVADGTVLMNGPFDDIVLDINARTNKGTHITIPLSFTYDINNDFIVFVDKNGVEEIEEEAEEKKMMPVNDGKFTMNLNASVTPDANVTIFLPMDLGVLNANGNGNLRLGLNENNMSLVGEYMINSGDFDLNLRNIVRKKFELRRGGTITWTGNVMDADIDVVGCYKTRSTISSLGVAVDSTAGKSTNNLNVNCLIRLTDKLMNPTITFGLELPNANDDMKNTVFSIIDTTNQAVVTQQVISLLVLNSFSYTSAAGGWTQFGTNTTYDLIANQLSNWLSQISKDFDIGLKFRQNENLSAEEIELALSTQLFDDRLTIETNFGYTYDNSNNKQRVSNIVGDVDVSFKLTKRLSLKAYTHSNVNSNYYSYSFENNASSTEGVGISYSRSFDKFKDIFKRNKKEKKEKNKKEKTRKERKNIKE